MLATGRITSSHEGQASRWTERWTHGDIAVTTTSRAGSGGGVNPGDTTGTRPHASCHAPVIVSGVWGEVAQAGLDCGGTVGGREYGIMKVFFCIE